MKLILLFLSFIIIASVTVGVMYLLFQLLVNLHPSKHRIMNDLRKMEVEIKPWINDLVPWKKEELELLSLHQVRKAIKKGVVITMKGIFTSIYDEPMIAYSYRQYRSAQKNAILFARTSHRQFCYRFFNGETTITIDNQLVGTIKNNGQLIAANGRQILAQIQRNEDELTLPVLVDGKDVAALVRSNQSQPSVNTRAFEYTSELGKQEEALVLSLSILEILKEEIGT